MKKNVNGIEMDMTEQEIAQREKDIQEYKDNELNIKLEQLRMFRNNFLSETDFYANSDVEMSDEMKTYRQQLRDLTNGLDTVEKIETKMKVEDGKFINFPTKPSEE
jgi:uncharacterized protein (DUF2164 family)|tara:strand:+ start:672 stop:989 length:318 start_codon:yes stop_codon:yes gene_type:complete